MLSGSSVVGSVEGAPSGCGIIGSAIVSDVMVRSYEWAQAFFVGS